MNFISTYLLQNAATFPCPPGLYCPDSPVGINDFILTVINWMLGIVLGLVVLFLIIGGFLYITSAGNEERATRGRTTVVNALIGLVLVILSYAITITVYNFFSTPQ